MKIEIGQPAPDFTLYDSDKNKLTLSDLRGQNILILFFPLAFTNTCTEELCYIRDNLSHYNQVNARVLGISVDALHSLAQYKTEQGLNFTLLSDFNKEVSTRYDCLYEMFSYNMQGVSKRASFIIDKKGILQYAEVLENADRLPDFESINRILGLLS